MDTTNTPSPTGPAPTPAPLTPETTPELTGPQAETVARWLKEDVAKGKLSPEAASKAFDQLQTPAADRVDSRTEGEKEWDAAGFVPAKPEDYSIRLHAPGEEPTPQHVQAGMQIRGYMSEGGLPKPHGDALFKAADETVRLTAGMNEDELAEFGRREYAKLQHLYGDQLEAKLKRAGDMIREIEARKPGLQALLGQRGIGDAARTVSLILDQSERYWARRGQRGA